MSSEHGPATRARPHRLAAAPGPDSEARRAVLYLIGALMYIGAGIVMLPAARGG